MPYLAMCICICGSLYADLTLTEYPIMINFFHYTIPYTPHHSLLCIYVYLYVCVGIVISSLQPREAKWFPSLLAPASLDGSMAGDVGFDPVNTQTRHMCIYIYNVCV